jgi:hypothetical protein
MFGINDFLNVKKMPNESPRNNFPAGLILLFERMGIQWDARFAAYIF